MNDHTSSGSAKERSIRSRIFIVGGLVPSVIGIAATILMLSWLPQLPDPIAVHWSGSGANGYGPAVPFAAAPATIAILFSVFAVVFSWNQNPAGGVTWIQKLILVTSVWLATFLSFGLAASLSLQRGLSDAHKTPDVGLWLAIGAALAFGFATVAWFLLPPGKSIDEPGTDPVPLDVRGEERVSWSHTARFGTTALSIVGLAIVVALSVLIITALGKPGSTLLAVIVVVVVLLLTLTNFWWSVSADHRGFIARSALGWPRKRIRLGDIRSVSVVHVHPTRDFGGWGWRWTGGGRSGVILRAGAGIEVTQNNGSRFTITVDDAETGAGVLVALLTRSSAHTPKQN